MAQWLICPYWVSEHRTLEDDVGRTYQADYQVTEMHTANPGDSEGRLDLVFYEARGDGNFYRADWASGSWSAPPRYQRSYRPDPSLVYGDSFFTYGWFEMWMSLDEMVMDVAVSKITRNLAAGVVESTSQRTLLLVTKLMPLRFRLPELFGRPVSPFTFPGGTVPGGGDGSVVIPGRP
jgi:hypothetical protein